MPIQNACKEINFAASKRYFIDYSIYEPRTPKCRSVNPEFLKGQSPSVCY